ncbi:MAG: acyl-CoA dehydrogenase family protein [Dehalococcoidia bacterium]|nr:acyl-CoA dehydrogenase family protein [Dehalococcoidia bacterium]
MDFSYGEDLEKLRNEVRAFLAQEWHPDSVEDGHNVDPRIAKEFRRKLAKRGWLALSVPKEYGGAGLSAMEQYVFVEEMAYHNAPTPGFGPNIVAPTLVRVGSEDQKKRFLPGIMSGEVEFCLGYTEPAAGSDLASMEARAVEDGDDYVINGQKVFNTYGHHADWCWLAARTDPDVPKHKGISIFMVDMKSPGVTVGPIWTMGGWRVNAIYWDNVRVPKKDLVGEMNKGWYYMATALDYERFTVNPTGPVKSLFERLVNYVKETNRNDKPLKDDPDVREKLASLACDIQMVELIHHRSAWVASQGIVPANEAAMQKWVTTEVSQRLGHLGTQILGLYGQLEQGSKYAPLQGLLESHHRAAVVGPIAAGSNEIQRNIVATRGLGLPR